MSAAWAGIIVRDLAVSSRWYAGALRSEPSESGDGWVAFGLDGGGKIELFAGDPRHPGLVFPSYGADEGPPVMPGLGVPDVAEAADGLDVMRMLPDWVVVAAPGGLRVVLTEPDGEPGRGLVGFAFDSPEPAALRRFLSRLGLAGEIALAERHRVVPLVAGDRDADLVDPDGSPLRLVRAGAVSPR